MSKVLTIGGATQDIYLHYHGSDCMKIMENLGERSYMLFESGSKIEVEKILYYTGGGATNSAVSFKRLGFDVTSFCMVGEDGAGKSILQDLEQEGVDISKVLFSKEHASGTSFIINSLKRDRTIFAYRGANGFLDIKNLPLELIKNVDQLYITSLSNESAKVLEKVVASAKEHNVPVAINPGKSQLSTGALELKKSLKYIDILILNSCEAKTFMGALIAGDEQYRKVFECEHTSIEECNEPGEACLLKTPMLQGNLYFSITTFFKEVMKMGPKVVVVTDGARGVYVATDDRVLFHQSLATDVVDTLGAGDSFGSCFVGGIRRGLKVEDALRCGIVNSASVIGHIGAKPGLLTYEELEKRVKKVDTGLLSQYKL